MQHVFICPNPPNRIWKRNARFEVEKTLNRAFSFVLRKLLRKRGMEQKIPKIASFVERFRGLK